jgi:hypothetical protein
MTSGDMVEEMARAIRAAIDASDHLAAGPRDVGEEYHGEQRTLLYVDGAFDLNAAAQAAATIAKGRIEALVRNAYEEGVEDGVEWGIDPSGEPKPGWIDSVARVELLKHTRAAIKDSPNVG